MESLHPSRWVEPQERVMRLVPAPLAERLEDALGSGDERALAELAGTRPDGWRDTLLTLARIHDLHLAPLGTLDGSERFQHHPSIAALKWALEEEVLSGLASLEGAAADASAMHEEAIAAIRHIAASDMVPPVYDWLATSATMDQLVEFLTYEGGPDAGFDDLVAAAQIGVEGGPKLALADNYWDEMGNGSLAKVHTELHRTLVAALNLTRIPRDELPDVCLERSVFGGLLATNRRLQPEMLGALGLIELQAGPRCRKVVAALHRVDAPADAFPFYEEHATVDPGHGKIWLDDVVAPLSDEWGERMVRGARWRSLVNARFFEAMRRRFVLGIAV